MPEDNKKLDTFIGIIMNDAKNESASIIAAVDADREAAIKSAEAEYAAEAEHFVQSETARARAESGRAISKKLLDDKRSLYQYRQKLSDELTGAVKARLDEFTQTPGYSMQLEKLLRRALSLFDGLPVTVFLRPADMPLADGIKEAFPGADLTFAEGNIESGGLICTCPGRQLSVDLTFDAKLADLSSRYPELFTLEV